MPSKQHPAAVETADKFAAVSIRIDGLEVNGVPGPKGDDGADGATGAKGDKGDAGDGIPNGEARVDTLEAGLVTLEARVLELERAMPSAAQLWTE